MLLFFLLVQAAIFVHLAAMLAAARLNGVACERVRFGIGPKIAGTSRAGTAYDLLAVPLGCSVTFVEQPYAALSRGRRLVLAAAPVGVQIVLGVLLIGGLPEAGNALAAFARGTAAPSDGGTSLAGFARELGAAPAAAFGAVLVCSGALNALPLHPSAGGRTLVLLAGGDDVSSGRATEAWGWASMVLYLVLLCLWGWVFVAAIRA